MENGALLILTIVASCAAFLALVVLSVCLLRMRARRRHFLERSIRWNFPAAKSAERPPVLPLVVRSGSSGTAKHDSFSRFSWFISEDKLIATHDYKDPVDILESDQRINFPEPAVVRASTRSPPPIPVLGLAL
ncbi:hypothetical protein FB451DRAFT_1397787 [Mycena latifolia]|nr:hypothetical protein FB451DRAFT_1397787 [Mycena latifolia]